MRPALQLLNKMLEKDGLDAAQYADWRSEVEAQRTKFPMRYPDREDVIAPQHAVEVGTVDCISSCVYVYKVLANLLITLCHVHVFAKGVCVYYTLSKDATGFVPSSLFKTWYLCVCVCFRICNL